MLLPFVLFPQKMSNRRENAYPLVSDTIRPDTLSLVPGSLELRLPNGTTLDTSLYRTAAAGSLIIVNRAEMQRRGLNPDTLRASYRVLPYNLSANRSHKDAALLRKASAAGANNPFTYTPNKEAQDIFRMEGLNKSGSLSRGIMFGNNQDVVVNSNLNLQLSGKLSNNIGIALVATDNNIPIQAEGNTQQLQEFDKVYIELTERDKKLTAGDFLLERPAGYFMNFNKKARGLQFTGAFGRSDTTGLMKLRLSGAVSKGKFARNQIQGLESNQGPYRLRGAENEPFIIVLSGTEQVYIDGRLLRRGQDEDYIIDYNNAEITFTSKQLITKDKRIVVEFQYSDKNYARSLFHFGDEYTNGKVELRLNVYSEQDSKNQPLQQQLSEAQKKILADAGDSLELAVSSGIDSVEFNSSEVLYAKRDTTVNSVLYTGVLVYSTSPDSAHYRARFSFVGAGKGNYKQVSSGANGKVFRWYAPVGGVPQGDHEPVVRLVSPRQKQMVTLGASVKLSPHSKVMVEGAFSNNNINTFSGHDRSNDEGYAAKAGWEGSFPVGKPPVDKAEPLKVVTAVGYEFVHRYFSPIERFRSVEFERDWNIISPALQGGNQHIGSASLGLVKKGTGALGYSFSLFDEGDRYEAMRHGVAGNYAKKGFKASFDGSLLGTQMPTGNTEFLRHKASVSQRLRFITVGLREAQEQNIFRDTAGSMGAASFGFFEWEGFVSNADTLKNKYMLSYKRRTDEGVKNNSLGQYTLGEDISFTSELLRNPDHVLKTNATWRQLSITDTSVAILKPDNTLVGRTEYNARFFKGALASNTYYEIGSGLEAKKEFAFIEVAAGQGIYAWNDFNSNGVQELNEFVVAAFPDQAKYIKVFIPTNEFIYQKTYTNQFSQVIFLRPAVVWVNKKGFKKLLSLFADQASYRIDKKTTNTDLAVAYNPFAKQVMDSTLLSINSSMRNTVYFNQNSPVAGIDYTWQDMRNKASLINGFDSRVNTYHEVKGRWNITRKWTTAVAYTTGRKLSNSQFFSTKNFQVLYFTLEPRLSFQPNTSFRTSLLFKYTEKQNSMDFGGQQAVLQDYGAELKYNILQKGSLNAQAHFIEVAYNDAENTNVGWEMLEGLKIGQNITWGLSYQRSIAGSMQVSITYDGRKTEGNKVIHTGGAEVRAFF